MAVHARRAEEHLLTALELGRSPAARRAGLARSHASNAGRGSATTKNAMCACCSPQNSAHCPRNARPVGLEATAFVWPGIMSIFRFSSGTQKLCTTSALETRR